MELFVIDPETRLVDINKEWIGTIPELKKLISRDRGSPGDADGRKKLQAIKEFTLIYHYCDYKSKFTNFAEEDKLHACLVNADLSPKLDITADEDLFKAITKYRSLQNAPSLGLLTELKEGLHFAKKVVIKVRQSMEIQLLNLDLNKAEEQ